MEVFNSARLYLNYFIFKDFREGEHSKKPSPNRVNMKYHKHTTHRGRSGATGFPGTSQFL
jgi:hypothetical protein